VVHLDALSGDLQVDCREETATFVGVNVPRLRDDATSLF
jgi:hypothetical protein